MSLFSVKLHVILIEPVSLLASLTHIKTLLLSQATVIKTKMILFQLLTILQHIKTSRKSLIC